MVLFIFCLRRDTIIYLQHSRKNMYIRGTEVVLLWNKNKESTNVITAYLCSDLSRSSCCLYTDQRTTLHHRHCDSPGTFKEKYPLPSDSIPSLHSKKASFLAPHAMTDRSSEDVCQECHHAPGGICRLNCLTD